MDGKRGKFVCPHCNRVMEVDMIYFHVREIFNSPLYRCYQCNFSTNITFHRDHHKSLTGHQLDGNNNLNLPLEKVINSATIVFMNSVIHGSESTNAVENFVKSEETKEIDSSKKPTGGNGNSINTVTVQRIDDSEQREKFFLDTINSINKMSFEYEKNNSSSRAVEVVEISADPKSPKQKYNFPIPLFCKNKMTICQKCGEEVNEDYLSRRKHVFLEHQIDIKDQLKDLTRLKKTDILFKGFMNIYDCFPEYAVCSDFQCIECDRYYGSFKGMKYHVGASHQNIIRIKCPFKNCDFKTGGGYQANDHIRTHMKGNGNNKDKVSIRNLASYISAQRYATFKSSCDRGDQMVEKMLNHYFPICVSHYGNFQDDFKKDLSEFKRSYLKPYVLYD